MQTTSQIDPTDDSDRMRNARRAAWARLALETFAHATGLNLDPEGDGPDTAIGDMLTDLRHYVAALGLDFDEINDRSAYRFADEFSDQGGDDAPGDDSPTELHALFSIALEQERAALAAAPEPTHPSMMSLDEIRTRLKAQFDQAMATAIQSEQEASTFDEEDPRRHELDGLVVLSQQRMRQLDDLGLAIDIIKDAHRRPAKGLTDEGRQLVALLAHTVPDVTAILAELQRQRGFAEDTLKDYEDEIAPEERDGDDTMNIECAKAAVEAWDEAIKIVTTALAGPEPTQPAA